MAPTISTTVYSASSSPFFHSGLQTGEQSEDQISQMGDFDDDGATIETASLTEVDISEIQNDLYASKFLPVTHTLQPQPGVYGENVKFVSHHGLGGSSQQYPPVGDDATADDDMDDTGKHLVHFPSTPSLRHKDTRKDMRINTISTSTQDPFDSSKWSSAELEQMDSQGHRYHYITRSQSSATYPPRPRSSYYPYSNYNPSLSNSTPHLSAQFRNYYDSRYRGNLSPIEERSFSQEDSPQSPSFGQAFQGDSASLHSNLSVQSSLFINRPVNPSRMRRSTSTSTMGSAVSLPPPRTPVKETSNAGMSSGSNTSPMASGSGSSAVPSRRGHQRSFSALSTIIASPRESQTTVLDPQTTPRTFSSLPLPRMDSRTYLQRPISTSRISDVNETESVQSGLTAQDSDSGSRRPKSEAPHDITGRAQMPGNNSQVLEAPSNARPNGVLHGFKVAISSNSAKLKQWTFPGRWLTYSPDHLPRQVDRIPQQWYQKDTGKAKTSEMLFWMGFIGPWFWIIGGWQLGRNGNVVDRDKRRDPGPSGINRYNMSEYRDALARLSTRPNVGSCFVPDPNARPMTVAMPNTRESAGLSYIQGPSIQPQISDPSKVQQWLDTPTRETFMEPPRNNRTSSVQGLKSLHLVEAQTQQVPRVDVWVTRCRIAAVLAGVIILALCVVAIVALALAL